MNPTRTGRWAAGLLVICLMVAAASQWRELNPEVIKEWFTALGGWGMAALVLIYIPFALAMLPITFLVLAGGALYGPVVGFLCNLTGAGIGAMLAFAVARYLGAEWVSRRGRGTLGTILAGIDAEGWRFVAFSRLVPVIPYFILNYLLGVTRIPFIPYAITSVLGLAPSLAAVTWIGHVGYSAATGEANWGPQALIAGTAAGAVLLLLPTMIRRWRQRMAELRSE